MSKSTPFFFLSFILCTVHVLHVFKARAETEIELPAIIKHGSAADVLMEDSIMPVSKGSVQAATATGSLQRSLENSMPLTTSDRGRPGGLSQFKGLGQSSEDTDVQTLGIPLNGPQGGGFDFSAFPQFLWSDYRFQAGPSLSAFDPRGISGTLALIPWTERALSGPSDGALRGTGMYSSAGVSQLSAAARTSDTAVIGGWSHGDIEGPSGGVSAKWGSHQFHLLATGVDVMTRGSMSQPSPRAHQSTTRVIPVLQSDFRISGGTLWKNTVFYDGGYLHYENPDQPSSETKDLIQHFGTENALLFQEWKFGLSARHLIYKTLTFDPPQETQANLQISRVFESGELLMEPTLQGIGISRFGFLPSASFGVRYGVAFARASLSRRFPSMTDRYYSFAPYYYGNPDLKPERDWTVSLGEETRSAQVDTSVQIYTQLREDAQILMTSPTFVSSKVNSGRARVIALMASITGRPAEIIEISNSTVLTNSRILATGTEFPYMPVVTHLASASVRMGDWKFTSRMHLASSAWVDTGVDRLSGYGTLDLDAEWRILKGFRLVSQAENVFDRPIERVKDYPSQGRVLSMTLVGEY